MMLRRLATFVAISVVVAVCGGDDGESSADTSTTSPPTTTAPPTTQTPTTTTEAPTKTTTQIPTTTVPLTALEELGYPISDEYVVETVVSGLDSGTGGLAIDADGYFYQADFGYPDHVGNTVYRISPDGSQVETLVQSDLMNSLTMTVFGPDGTMYQSSYNSDRVFTISTDGTAEVTAEGLRGPTGIVVADDGTLFVEAYDSNTLYKILLDGTVEEVVFDRRFNGINGMTQGPDGTLYLVDFKDGSIFSVAADGTVDQIHKFPEESSHVVYHDGGQFVTSRGGYVVFRYDLATGDAEIIAGSGEPGDQDGRGGESAFGRPNAITIGPDGNLYINHGDGTDSLSRSRESVISRS